ncbi:aminopeptidase [Halococcus saccharolyticus]|uniref:Aminopeptidase n=1 Tax=Halococcus saccharolyticus DSM 5350 TaxID=1227455 RepID=M0MED7_9EURY|nr:aminopeptidase [Halococcus saccharolyticus]EMA42780.1 aminopeptidase [Halococcus saccharolyticus DSM 5350]
MDPRVREHADVLVEHCCDVTADDNVLIHAPPAAEDLVVALYERLGERGARPALHWSSGRAGRAYARAMDPDEYRTADHTLAEMEETDVVFMIGGSQNTAETSDVAPEMSAARGRAHEPIFKERLAKQWVITQHPTAGNAQKAEMSTEAYNEFVYRAVNKDWDAQREHQAQMVEILDPASEVRIVSGETTDISMSIDGMDAANDDGEMNMPGGEVFTVPVPESVAGEVRFDKPLLRSGREIEDAFLRFEDGEVVEHSAEKNEDLLTSILDTDEGARRLGELGIGMNRDIDRFTYNMLFDEKMGDTVHMAVGDAIDECVPDDAEKNESAQHVDMIVDTSEDSRIEIDGEVIQRNGTFRFEDGFDA